jgi:hypothetical protein
MRKEHKDRKDNKADKKDKMLGVGFRGLRMV